MTQSNHASSKDDLASCDECLTRIEKLHPKLIDLSLTRLISLLKKLGDPHKKLPPIIHVAGTNGKGSTCANLISILKDAGRHIHFMSSPHLISLTERFIINGQQVSEKKLSETLARVEEINNNAPITVFEILTAVGFLLFSENPADIIILEVGLGGRFDATNVITPIVSIITSISLDHEHFLGDTCAQIAVEKAGIIKPQIPVICAPQADDVMTIIKEKADQEKSPLYQLKKDISWEITENQLKYYDEIGDLSLPLPKLHGLHQQENAVLAIAALRFSGLDIPLKSYQAISKTIWPGRLQKLTGKLTEDLPDNWEIWVDGAHNEGGATALQSQLIKWQDQPLHLIIGMKDTKNPLRFLSIISPYATDIYCVSEEDQLLAMPLTKLMDASKTLNKNKSIEGPTVKESLQKLMNNFSHTQPRRILICGSLYLVASILKKDI